MAKGNGVCMCGLGLAIGVTWGLAMLITGLMATYYNWGNEFVSVMGSVYRGFDATFKGSYIGLAWGFADGFIAGVVVAWLYNFFSGKCSRH